MRETKPCPQCGAQMQHRDKNGDVACAYCNTVLFMAEAAPVTEHQYDPYPFSMMGSRMFLMGSYSKNHSIFESDWRDR